MNVVQACDRCHRRKTRCDKLRPECGPCTRAAASCIYSERVKEPVYRRDFVERLERRVKHLEATNQSLRERLTTTEEDVTEPSESATPSLLDQESTAADTDKNRETNEVANEVSFLSTSAGGDRQFLGSASGFLFASLVRASVAVPRQGREALASGASARPFDSANLDWGIDGRELPPEELARSLIEAYLVHDHLCFPILPPQSVSAALTSIYNDPEYHESHPFEAFVFHMLLAIATSQIHKFNWQALPDAETHHLRATVYLNAVLCEGGLRALQAMLLLCQFRLSSSTKDASGSLWHIVGISARMCFELGLHRESTYKLKLGTDSASSAYLAALEEQEVRRRCFWCVFALDRVVSITLGRPLAICLEDIDVELPSLDMGMADSAPSPSSLGSENDHNSMFARSRTAIFVHIVRYRRLCGKLLTTLHRGSRSMAQPEHDLRRIQNELGAELEAWRSDTSSLNLPEMDLSTPIAEARSSFRSKAWYELLYHNGVLLLYRPFSATIPSSGDGPDLQRMFMSAKHAITLYSYLFRSRKINFSWITLHATFMAGLSYVYAVSRHIRETRKQRATGADGLGVTLAQEPSIMEIVNDCRACSNVLVAVSERCNAQKSCHEVFDRLSDAILADAVDLLSNSASNKRSIGPPQDGGLSATPTRSTGQSSSIHQMASPASSQQVPLPFQPPSVSPAAQDPNSRVAGDFGGVPLNTPHMFLEPALAADNVLRDCFPEMQRTYETQWGNDAIIQLGVDWLGEIDPGYGMQLGQEMDTSFM
ncbi:hypothetical protein GQ53DRAFT_345188 [Thozetella sp. PMI_491]|nr:hypothetical protein GQ53DRAFT_345188 [Thozetella sp. PMI_491]